ncbi:MAG: MerR family transcriptional regulator [Bacteroidetes bacterium]|uniref:MerR family transcriptional regulator n=1 Tax=Candidatus Cryptobacteroides avicola TaxID=2840757 RepID=A0A940IHW1_9BACT|nr:MerR family transcriptional regulator [Candidatus Cryptobacteroides avicola]
MEKLYYTIGEVADMLGESVSLVRFWSNSFPSFIRPVRNAKGNRLYTAEDLDTFRQIHFLVKDCGLSLERAARQMKEDRRPVESRIRAIEILKSIRSQLDEIRKDLMPS